MLPALSVPRTLLTFYDCSLSTKHSKDIDAKELQKLLVSKHPDWKVPERRVNKFLKRYLNPNNQRSPASADDDETLWEGVVDAEGSTPTKKRKSGKFFTRIFSPRKNAVAVPESAPEAAPTPVVSEEPEKKEEEPEVAEPAAVVEASRDIENVYEDDNKGSEKDKCECNACCIM